MADASQEMTSGGSPVTAPRSSSSRTWARPSRSGCGGGSGPPDPRGPKPPSCSRRHSRPARGRPAEWTGTMLASGRPRSVTIHSVPRAASRRISLSRAFASRTPTVRWTSGALPGRILWALWSVCGPPATPPNRCGKHSAPTRTPELETAGGVEQGHGALGRAAPSDPGHAVLAGVAILAVGLPRRSEASPPPRTSRRHLPVLEIGRASPLDESGPGAAAEPSAIAHGAHGFACPRSGRWHGQRHWWFDGGRRTALAGEPLRVPATRRSPARAAQAVRWPPCGPRGRATPPGQPGHIIPSVTPAPTARALPVRGNGKGAPLGPPF